MTKISWHNPGNKIYETGVDRGVLYIETRTGIPWSGLTAVEEDLGEEEAESVYLDGVKILDLQSISDYKATLRAFTYPDEFMECEGIVDEFGLLTGNQPQKTFNLCYRTLIANDISGIDYGYKIHIVYNLTAIPEETVYTTNASIQSPIEFAWSLVSVPEVITDHRPTAHVIFDTRFLHPLLIADLENQLYGSDTSDASLPSLEFLVNWALDWALLKITDNGDGTWTAEEHPGVSGQYITMLNATTFQIDSASAEYVDANTYTISTLYDYGPEDVE